ncbi:MAG: acyl-CoA dehydrogenase [Firmicutes bacterium]|nr:acyl-CoA dehydrogenase [Bacillota bacterium]
MSLPNRSNPYSFQEWLEKKRVNFLAHDEFLQKCIRHYVNEGAGELIPRLMEFAEKVSFRWDRMAAECARPENRPYLIHYDAYHNRIDRVVLPQAMVEMEREVFGHALFSERTGHWERFIKMMLLNQNGEAGIGCPVVCTEGLVRAIEELTEPGTRHPEVARILDHCRDGTGGEFGMGAQFLTEIHGGSDVPANIVEAEYDGEGWRIYGTKFFCSAVHADYFIITAKPTGSEAVAMFLMPAWLPGNREREVRNSYTIDRLKWKMGTVELPTAELTFNGSVAYPLGDLRRGVSNVVGIVLSYSRLTVGAACSGSIIRAVRDALLYSGFREAFGKKIDQFPLLVHQLRELEATAQRALAGSFKLFDYFLKSGGRFTASGPRNESREMKKLRFLVRELVLFAKLYTSKVCTQTIHEAMSVFGGHGVIEDFTVLPRLYRDSNINELWEGPRNVLLAQIHNDFQRNSGWYSAEEFIETCLAGADSETIGSLTESMTRLLSHPDLQTLDEDTIRTAAEWDRFADEFMRAFQEQARREVICLL